MAAHSLTIFAASLIEICLLRPALFERGFPHPVNWVAALINTLERSFNRPEWRERKRFYSGIANLTVIVVVSGGLGFVVEQALSRLYWGWLPIAVIGAFGLAARNLYDHVSAVLVALDQHDLSAARNAVGRIVGRDTASLDEYGIATAATESLAESFCDGVIAPLFWFLLGGLAGQFVYKAVNTADSLIGHKEPRWRAFGWAAARMDDLLNFVPARLSGALIVLAAGGKGWRVMLRDAKHHASPNGGWPEAAMAGTLDCRLGGPVSYDGIPTARAVLGNGLPPENSALLRALTIYCRANLLAISIIVMLSIIC